MIKIVKLTPEQYANLQRNLAHQPGSVKTVARKVARKDRTGHTLASIAKIKS